MIEKLEVTDNKIMSFMFADKINELVDTVNEMQKLYHVGIDLAVNAKFAVKETVNVVPCALCSGTGEVNWPFANQFSVTCPACNAVTLVFDGSKQADKAEEPELETIYFQYHHTADQVLGCLSRKLTQYGIKLNLKRRPAGIAVIISKDKS